MSPEAESPDATAPHEVSAAQALEAALEGVPGSISMAPAGSMPALGGELLLPVEQFAPGKDDDVESDTVRAGLLQAGPLALAGVTANAANVIVTILVARVLTTRGYGLLNQLTGLFLIVSMPGSAIIVGVVRRVTAWVGRGDANRVRGWARRIHAQGTLALVVFIGVVAAAGSFLAGLLNQPNEVGVIAILAAGAVWVLLSLDRGLLQAHRNYRSLAINLLVEGGARTVGIAIFLFAGFGASGVAVGVLLGEIVTAIHARIAADRTWGLEEDIGAAPRAVDHRTLGHRASEWLRRMRRDPALIAPRAERRDLATDLVVALSALAMLALLQNIDVIVMGRDNPGMSGSYAAVSVASKAIVYGAVVLGGYLLPEAAIRWKQGGHALRQFFVALVLLALPAVVLVIAATIFPRLLLSLVFSRRYLGAEAAFTPLVLAMCCLSLTVILTMYLLAVGRRWISPLLIVGALVATILMGAAHGSPIKTARYDLLVQAVLALAALGGFIKIHHRRVLTS